MAEVLDLTASDDECHETQSSPVKHEYQTQTPSLPRRPQFNNDQDVPKLTIVNGRGFWKSWTRSFRSTLLKLLDLIDNSVDGATMKEDTPGFVGRVHIYPDVYERSTTSRKGRKQTSTTGLCIRNNCPHKIVPLSEALVVHQTNKIDEGEIGENGVGLKQACAALCDLSFVLVKNGSNANIELGIVAKALQREEGPYLPAFYFSNEKEDGKEPLREQMASLFSRPKHDDVAQCIAQYGADIAGGDPSLAAGIDGICRRFDDICYNFYDSDYVFEVILNKIRHGQEEEGLVRRALDAQQKITVNQLMKDLQRDVPRTYLHLPDSFEFIVGEKKLLFRYWQERLVELSTFTVSIGSTIPWKTNFEVSDEHPDAYELRLFIGFDRYRIVESDIEPETGEKREGKNASLYIYSRRSGRLVKCEPDARHLLGLSATGTHFASALTIIIDDIGANIPLSPTKQDTAFGLESKGAVHEENLFAWVGAVTKFYYNYHLRKYSRRAATKSALNAKISHFVDSEPPQNSKTLDESDFTTFELVFEQFRNAIQVDWKQAKEIVGSDTHYRLVSGSTAKKRTRSSERKRSSEKDTPKKANSSGVDNLPSKRSRSQPISYQEDSDSFDEEEQSDNEKAEQKTRKKKALPSDADKMASKPSRSQTDTDSPDEVDQHVKMEYLNMESVDNSACINLCDSSDDEGGDAKVGDQPSKMPSNMYESQTAPGSDTYGSNRNRKIQEVEDELSKARAESEAKIETLESENKVLRDSLAQARDESKTKIESLENENKVLRDSLSRARAESAAKSETLENENKILKERLEQKERVVSVLKKRLCAK